jgi:hypothetical protein
MPKNTWEQKVKYALSKGALNKAGYQKCIPIFADDLSVHEEFEFERKGMGCW